MGISKGTRIQDRVIVHTWTDPDADFAAEVRRSVVSGWDVETYAKVSHAPTYQSAVDWVMDQYRLKKAGLESWEDEARVLAGDAGSDWDELSDDEQQDYINSVRFMARRGEVR